jgi:ABC-type lipoprotein release transport system permease subunit
MVRAAASPNSALAAVGFAAALGPARRAARFDPMSVLKADC